jgi:hypothetical protein
MSRHNDKVQLIVTRINSDPAATPIRSCAVCGKEIATLITATTPANPRRHLVKVPTAAIVDDVGNTYCAGCGPAALERIRQAEALLVLGASSRVYTIDPTYNPADAADPDDSTTPSRTRPGERFVIRHSGRVVADGRNGKNGSGKA